MSAITGRLFPGHGSILNLIDEENVSVFTLSVVILYTKKAEKICHSNGWGRNILFKYICLILSCML